MDEKVQKGVSTSLILVEIVCLAIGGGGGYFFSYTSYQPRIDGYESRIVSLENDVSASEVEKAAYLSQVSDLESDIMGLEDEISDAKITISEYAMRVLTLESVVSSLNLQKKSLESSVNYYESEVSELEDQIETMLDVKATQYYEWDYQGTWTWTIHIPMSLYMEYYTRDRPSLHEDWIEMADDPGDDYYIDQLVDSMEKSARTERFNEIEMVEYVIAFVQGLPYTSDTATTGSDEYPRYPIETLFDRGGDCEDTSILTAALLNELGYDVALLLYDEHVAVGIVIDTYGTFYNYDDKRYFYLETTGEGWEIGYIPEAYEDEGAYVYPLNG